MGELTQFLAKYWQAFLVFFGACVSIGGFFGGLIAGFMNRRQIKSMKDSAWRAEAAAVKTQDMVRQNGTPPPGYDAPGDGPFERYAKTHPGSSNVYLKPPPPAKKK